LKRKAISDTSHFLILSL